MDLALSIVSTTAMGPTTVAHIQSEAPVFQTIYSNRIRSCTQVALQYKAQGRTKGGAWGFRRFQCTLELLQFIIDEQGPLQYQQPETSFI